MTRTNFYKAVIASAFAMLMLACMAGTARAQCPGCPNFPGNSNSGYWINYDYVYGPCGLPVNNFFVVSVQFQNNHIDVTSETADGHYTYLQDPAWGDAQTVTIDQAPGSLPFPGFPVTLPIQGKISSFPSPCGGQMDIEAKCNPCLEIKIHI